MIKPNFLILFHHYPRSELREKLFHDIGWDDLIDDPAYRDTCATRVSVGLARCGVALPGARFTAKAGSIKGWGIEPGQGKLSNILKRIWDAPEVYRGEAAARDGIGQRVGIVSFFHIHGGGLMDGGHIDLVIPNLGSRFQDCARSCFFSAVEIWFWPLK